MKNRNKIIIICFLFGSLFFLPGKEMLAQETDYKSYSLFVYNFMKYIEWPPENAKSDFVIGVFGDSPIIKELETLAASKKAKGKTIVIKKLASIDENTNCQLIYVASGKSGQLKTILPYLKSKSILLVTERDGLAKKGADLSFTELEDDILKFEINKQAIEAHNLKIPSSLISLGILVK